MVKHRRWSDKPKPTHEDEKTELSKQEVTSETSVNSIKAILTTITKYVYIVGAVALLSGIFTPITLGIEFESVIFGMLAIFLGLGGGIVIFLAIKNQKLTTIMISAGLAMIAISLILIHEMAERSLFG